MDKKLEFEKHSDAVKHLREKSSVKCQVLRSMRAVKVEDKNPSGERYISSLRGFRKAVDPGDTGRAGLPATTGEFATLACPEEDNKFGQNKELVALWCLKVGDKKPKIRFVSDAEYDAGVQAQAEAGITKKGSK